MGVNEYIKIGQRMKNVRLSKKISQAEMAEKLVLAVSTYANYEADRREAPFSIIKRFCHITNTDIDDLMDTSKMSVMTILNKGFGAPEILRASSFKNSGLQMFGKTSTIDVSDLTDDEVKQVKQYIKFLKSQRNNKTTD